jgi:hypothetical protein
LQLGPIEKKVGKKIDGLTTVFGFEYARDGKHYWLVGTSSAQLHLLSAWDTAWDISKTTKVAAAAAVGAR